MNTKLFIKHSGNIEKPPIILLHGWGFQHHIWDDFVSFLIEDFSVFQIDLFGYGQSPMLEPYSLENIAKHLVEQLPENALWVGWSLGGLIAQFTAFNYPNKIKGLFLIGSSPCFVQKENWQYAMAEATLDKFAFQLEKDWAGTLQRFLALQLQGDDQAKFWLKKLRFQLQNSPAPHPLALNAGLQLLKSADLRNLCEKSIPCPTFLCFGRRDALVPASLSDAWCGLNPALQSVIIEGAAHTPFLSHAPDVLTALRRFWNEIR
jgi:pimeloyl-[acyl-carrier protein] methyl ester esterase